MKQKLYDGKTEQEVIEGFVKQFGPQLKEVGTELLSDLYYNIIEDYPQSLCQKIIDALEDNYYGIKR